MLGRRPSSRRWSSSRAAAPMTTTTSYLCLIAKRPTKPPTAKWAHKHRPSARKTLPFFLGTCRLEPVASGVVRSRGARARAQGDSCRLASRESICHSCSHRIALFVCEPMNSLTCMDIQASAAARQARRQREQRGIIIALERTFWTSKIESDFPLQASTEELSASHGDPS